MRTLVAVTLLSVTLGFVLAFAAPTRAGTNDIIDSYGRARVAPAANATKVDGCKTVSVPPAFTDAGAGTNNLQPDASAIAYTTDAGMLYDGSVQTPTCVTLERGKEYEVSTRSGTTACLSQTGKIYGAAGTNCDGHRTVDSLRTMSFEAAPGGGAPCVYAVSNSATSDKLDVCERVP